MQKTLEVKGMTCGHCEASVKKALGKLVGVAKVVVHLDSGKIDVTYDEAQTTEAEMHEAIEEQGYDVGA